MITRNNHEKEQPFNSKLYDEKCVSEICECGKHKCPPAETVRAPVRFEEHNIQNNAFKKCKCKCKKVQKNCSCKCRGKHQGNKYVYQERHYDPQSIQTVYQADFQGKYSQQDQLKRFNGHGNEGIFNHQSRAPFLGNTQYNTQFTGKLVQNDQGIRGSHNVVSSQPRPPFDGTTIYNTSYQGKYVERQHAIHRNKVAERPHIPFDGTTQYNSHYQYRAVECGGECESCCDCASEQCSSCCDCDEVDSLDQQVNTNYKNHSTGYQVTQAVYPQYPELRDHQSPLQKTQQNTNCPVKRLPPVPKKGEPGKTHTKFSAKKNIWK